MLQSKVKNQKSKMVKRVRILIFDCRFPIEELLQSKVKNQKSKMVKTYVDAEES
jgi:hypothetical protein